MTAITGTAEGIGGPGTGLGEAPQAPARPASALPCLLREQLNWTKGGKTQKKMRRRVELEVTGMALIHGFEHLAFFTGTFPDNVKTIREAQRRFNSMNTNAMRGRFLAWLSVVQRHKDGRIHLHLVVVCKMDVRTGFNFIAVRCRDYSSACAYLKAEWKFWRENSPKYGFGRMELLPVRTSVSQFAGYVSRYLTRQEGTRLGEKGARLVRYSKGWKTVFGAFSWIADRWLIERVRFQQDEAFCKLGIRSIADAEFRWGLGWRRHFNRLFYADPDTFYTVVSVAERSLEYYEGVDFALAEAWTEWDKRAAEAEEDAAFWRRYEEAFALQAGYQ
jgi:hypothetical protein